MSNAPATDCLRCLDGSAGFPDVSLLRRQVFSSKDSLKAFREFMSSLEMKSPQDGADRAALAACYCVEGRYERGLSLAADGKDDLSRYVACRCHLGLGRSTDAAKGLAGLVGKVDGAEVRAVYAEALRRAGDIDGAKKAVDDGVKRFPTSAAMLTEAGILADLLGDSDGAVDCYRKATEADGECAEAIFRLAFVADLRGDNDAALEYYQRCVSIKPVRTRALVNLGLLYEEIGRQGEAVRCFQLVYRRYPTDRRARLYLKDALASEDMFFDEEQQKRRERRNKVLETPITDFELSVRSRNCLEKMNVSTLGDLTRISEQDLLGFKNFGETSLNEIKQMLTSKGLRLGQALEEDAKAAAKAHPVKRKTIDRAKVLARPIDDLGLSVRSQHCMQQLDIKIIADLANKSEKDLMEAKNFGATSLTEVRKKLAALGLSLVGEE